MKKTLLLLMLPSLVFSAAPELRYRIVTSYPHDKDAFTQGLYYENGYLYESTGRWGESSLRKVEIQTGKVVKILPLHRGFFGEGLTLFDGRIYQITWKSRTGFVYDKNFNLIRKFHYFTEGWGLTHYKNHLVLSDGSNRLYFLAPENFRVKKQLEVFEGRKPLFRINEMETIGGKIFANIWESERIAIIHPETGQVIAWLNLKGLLSPQERENAGVLNGIAYIPEKNQILITGKNWPRLFVIALTSPF